MNPSEQYAYKIKWSQFQQKQEKYFERVIKKALSDQVDAFIKTKDVNLIPLYPMYEALQRLYKNVGASWIRLNWRDLEKAGGQMGINERILALMQQYYGANVDLLNEASGITDYTKEVIIRVLNQAAFEGWGIEQIVRELRQNSELSTMRARRIARTETVTAANQSLIAYAQTSGNVMEKTWLSIQDSRTRHDHKAINGRTVPLDDAFDLANGEVMMDHPGARVQPNGLSVPASQVVNCRCTMAIRSKRDANGEIITR